MISNLCIKVLYINQMAIDTFQNVAKKLDEMQFLILTYMCFLPRDSNLRFGKIFRCGEGDFCISRLEHSGKEAKCAIA